MEATKTIKTSPSQGWKQGKGHLWPTCWLLAWTEPDRGGGRRLIDSGCLVHASQKIWGGKQLLGALWPRLSRAEDFEFQEVSCFLSLESGRHHTLSPRTVQNFKTKEKDWYFYWTFSLTLLTLLSIWHCLLTLEYNHYQQLFHIHNYWLFSVREACTRRFRFFLVFFKQGLTPHHPPYLGNELKQIIWICGYMLPLVPTFSIKIMWFWQFAIESLLILLQGSNASQSPVQCFRRK